jgi:hypothetical protein
VTLDTSTSAEYCYNIPILDFLDFFDSLERVAQKRKENK